MLNSLSDHPPLITLLAMQVYTPKSSVLTLSIVKVSPCKKQCYRLSWRLARTQANDMWMPIHQRSLLSLTSYFISVHCVRTANQELTHILCNSCCQQISIKCPGEGIYWWLSANVTHNLFLLITFWSTCELFFTSPECRVYKIRSMKLCSTVGFY